MARRKRKMKGKGPVLDWIKKAARNVHNFVKDNRLISRGATALAPLAGPYSGTVSRCWKNCCSIWAMAEEEKRGRPKKK